MYVFTRKSGYVVWKEWWYALTLRILLRIDLYMIQKDHVFVVDVVVIDLMWEMVASSVIS